MWGSRVEKLSFPEGGGTRGGGREALAEGLVVEQNTGILLVGNAVRLARQENKISGVTHVIKHVRRRKDFSDWGTKSRR